MTDPNHPLPAAGWYRDPTGQGEARYWTGTAWAETISRGGVSFQSPVLPAQATVPPVPGSEFVAPTPMTPPPAASPQPSPPPKSSSGAIIGAIIVAAAIIGLIVVLVSLNGGDDDDDSPAENPPATEAPAEPEGDGGGGTSEGG